MIGPNLITKTQNKTLIVVKQNLKLVLSEVHIKKHFSSEK